MPVTVSSPSRGCSGDSGRRSSFLFSGAVTKRLQPGRNWQLGLELELWTDCHTWGVTIPLV